MLNELVQQALRNQPNAKGLDDVVEKEILHHDLLTVLHQQGFLQQLTFMGGTALRLCYNASRLSEDLDFCAGLDFKPGVFDGLGQAFKKHLQDKYALKVVVREPKITQTDTSTWNITIEKQSDRPDVPLQKMHIDVCALPSLDRQFRALRDHYGISSPLAGLPIPVESQAEILADKMIALAFRSRRIKPRDLWDIVWLEQQTVKQNPELVLRKLQLRNKALIDFKKNLAIQVHLLQTNAETKNDFYQEMTRFLPQDLQQRTLLQVPFWEYVGQTIAEQVTQLMNEIDGNKNPTFKM
jgi:predicted nucleotidyltransferase component of viral defense system